jgi:hypothetical protein
VVEWHDKNGKKTLKIVKTTIKIKKIFNQSKLFYCVNNRFLLKSVNTTEKKVKSTIKNKKKHKKLLYDNKN